MKQFEIILGRLKKPSVLLSLFSEIFVVTMLLNPSFDITIVNKIIASISSIFILLGIVSNPSTENNGYGDDIYKCSHCHKLSVHVVVDGKLICQECGCAFIPE